MSTFMQSVLMLDRGFSSDFTETNQPEVLAYFDSMSDQIFILKLEVVLSSVIL